MDAYKKFIALTMFGLCVAVLLLYHKTHHVASFYIRSHSDSNIPLITLSLSMIYNSISRFAFASSCNSRIPSQ